MTDCVSPPHSTLSLLNVTQQHINFTKVIISSALTRWKNKTSDEESLILVVLISAGNKKCPRSINHTFLRDFFLCRWTVSGSVNLSFLVDATSPRTEGPAASKRFLVAWQRLAEAARETPRRRTPLIEGLMSRLSCFFSCYFC